MSLVMRRPGFELLLKSLQIVSVNVGNGPVVEVRISPMQKLIAFMRHRHCRSGCSCLPRPNKQVNEMLTPLVNQGRHRPVIEIIKAAADQGKSLTGKIDNRRGKIELRVQPGFDSMLIRRSDVREVIRHKRADVTSYTLCREELVGSRRSYSRQETGRDNCAKCDSCGQSQPGPRHVKENGPLHRRGTSDRQRTPSATPT